MIFFQPMAIGTAAAQAVANRAPTISGQPATTAQPDRAYVFTPTASDPDRNRLWFYIQNRPPWANFDRKTGRLSGTPSSQSLGQYINIRILVTDGRLNAALPPFTVTVGSGTANRAPTISGSPPLNAREGQAYAFTPTATDPDGDRLTYSIVNRPPWTAFNTSTGALTGTPGTGSVGSYTGIRIQVSDGRASVSLASFAINVQQVALGSATLYWRAPTTRADGSPLTNLAGYRIRYGTSSGSYPNSIVVANAGLTTAVISNLPAATYYFVLSAYDMAGAESEYTAPVSKTIR